MAYTELEQFLGRGNEKIFWVLSLKDVGGLALGGFVGQRLGTALFSAGFAVILLTLLGAVCGLSLMVQYHGLLLGRRAWLILRFVGRRLRRRAPLPGSTPGVDAASDDRAAMARRDSRVRVRREVDGRPIFGPRSAADVSQTPVEHPALVADGTVSGGAS